MLLRNPRKHHLPPTKNYPACVVPKAIAAADLNQDGKVALASTDPANNPVVLYPGNGDGTFGTGAASDAGQQPVFLSTADFNSDGFPDLIAVDKAGNAVSILMNKAQ